MSARMESRDVGNRVAAVEAVLKNIRTRAAVDGVGVTVVNPEMVGAAAAVEHVIASAARDHVIAALAVDAVVAAGSVEDIVVIAAVDQVVAVGERIADNRVLT